MKHCTRLRRRATGLVRTLVVAASTLAILLVCFWIYQYSQVDPEMSARLRRPRLPGTPTQPAGYRDGDAAGAQAGVDTGRGRIGPGERIQITLYPETGDRARLEIAVRDWTPAPGSSDEFLLAEPEARMRTDDGHSVRITARRGILEARRKPAGGLDPERGKLTGDVLIQYDRLSESQRAALPEELRDRIDPADLVEIRADEVEFDLEYSKLVVPGRLHLTASDVELDATDLELRFNDEENRVEYLRISRGGRIELREEGEPVAISIPGIEARKTSGLSLVEWLRTSLAAKLSAQQEGKPTGPVHPSKSPVAFTDDGTPVFRPDVAEEEAPKPHVRYYARFSGTIDARELAGDVTRARLTADVLEILRDYSAGDRARMRSGTAGRATDGAGAAVSDARRIVLTWTDRLVVEACSPDDPRCAGDTRAQITARGAPLRVSRPEGEARCRRLVYEPDGTKVSLFGTEADPAMVRYADQGTVTGLEVHSERHGDEMILRVVGPGTLARSERSSPASTDSGPAAPGTSSMIEFTDELKATGRFVTGIGIDVMGGVSIREQRVLDRASFVGGVVIHRDNASIGADAVTVTFTPPRRFHSGTQRIERVVGRGHVVMTRGANHIKCRNVDIALTRTEDGRTVPRVAVALGDVAAEREGGATIQARDKLIVAFDTVSLPRPPADAGVHRSGSSDLRSEAAAAGAGRDNGPNILQRSETIVKRLQAFGDVLVSDPQRGLEVAAERLDCTLADTQEIETAFLEGMDDRPAVARLEDFTASGRQIELDVPEQRAEVPGAGRLTFRSKKDLDGRLAEEPIPIVITWSEWMKYEGRRNRSVFSGRVHATSKTTTTFDCNRLLVEFRDVPAETGEDQAKGAWRTVGRIVDRLALPLGKEHHRSLSPRISKEPTYILATGNAVALTSELDPATGALKSRARISGPQLSVNLLPEVSKMVIEGPGSLLLEDNRPPAPDEHASTVRRNGGLFAVDENAGPSNTLIEWSGLMWYDFGIAQTRFERDVTLKHFSGAELMRIRGQPTDRSANVPAGRATYLTCDVLTVDFLDRGERARRSNGRPMGRLSADRLKQFQASGSVVLQDQSEGLSVTADRVVFWKNRNVLAVYGTPRRLAHIVTQKPRRLPNQLSVERLFYDLGSGRWQLAKPVLRTR